MALSTDELTYMLTELPDSVSIAYGAQSAVGVLDSETATIDAEGGLQLSADEHVLTIRDGALTSLAMDSAITVNSVSYTIRDIGRRLTDGTRRVILAEA